MGKLYLTFLHSPNKEISCLKLTDASSKQDECYENTQHDDEGGDDADNHSDVRSVDHSLFNGRHVVVQARLRRVLVHPFTPINWLAALVA